MEVYMFWGKSISNLKISSIFLEFHLIMGFQKFSCWFEPQNCLNLNFWNNKRYNLEEITIPRLSLEGSMSFCIMTLHSPRG